MRIDFECSGGFANLQLTYHGNTDELPQDIAREFSKLVENAGFFDIQQRDLAPVSSGPPDVFFYQVSLSDGKRQNSLSFNDMTAPTSFRPLLTFLQQLVFDQRQKGLSS
jgi:hypothetical protein